MGEVIGDDVCSDKCRTIGCFDRGGTSCRDALWHPACGASDTCKNNRKRQVFEFWRLGRARLATGNLTLILGIF